MSFYSTSDYEFSFAQRTLKNLEFIQERYQAEKKQGRRDNEIEDVFEVTQLINSFVGLIIIPRELCYSYMPDDISFPEGSEAEKLLQKIKEDPEKCENTYKKTVIIDGKEKDTDEYEEISPKTLVHRLRNAVSHDHLSIRPVDPGEKGVIEAIEFSDKPTRKREAKKKYFKLILTVEEVEIMLRALSELLLSCYPK